MAARVQAKCGLVFAVLLNRLSSNTMPDAWRPERFRGRRVTVRVSRDGPDITSPGALIAALKDRIGASIDMGIVSRITSFGKGAALYESSAAAAAAAAAVSSPRIPAAPPSRAQLCSEHA